MMAINDVQYNFKAYLNEYGDQKMAEGLAEGIGKGEENKLLENLKSVMESFGVSPEEALDALKVPHSEYEKYKNLIKQSKWIKNLILWKFYYRQKK